MNEFSFAFPEVCLEEDYIIATYFVETESKDVVKYAVAVAEEQTTGTWIEVPGESNRVKIKHGGKVVSIFEVPDYEFEIPKGIVERKFIIQVAYPMLNFRPQIPMLLTTAIGNIANAGKLKLLDLNFPRKFVESFKGPKFGIEGLRQLLNIPERPFVNNMIKPCTGWTPEEGAAMSYEVARGGVDIIKDDELLAADESFCPLNDRIKAVMAAIKKAYEETGEKTLYTVNITDNVSKLKDNAKRAIEAGANALMINFYTVGFSAAQMITEDPEINVPILAHVDFSGAMFGSPYHGISSPLLMGKLARMAGADMAIITSPYGKFPVVRNKYQMQVNYARQELFGMKRLLPMLAGGATQGMVPNTMKELGKDICIAAGGAIHGHPMGPYAGAKSMRQSIDAAMKGVSLKEYSKDHPELAAIVDIWGKEDNSDLFDLKG
ncbi:RuBisCO large subunit C-terminal-like domain-containing protein [Desulfitobacterium sp. AusDCA]|uniref:RuBisCO large subunit C-terminal-like domain-containing protein n=1 Tax=Desulfitobacterium sp. AusDCA TaxID=3240383 RepID=UPI003DA75EC0